LQNGRSSVPWARKENHNKYNNDQDGNDGKHNPENFLTRIEQISALFLDRLGAALDRLGFFVIRSCQFKAFTLHVAHFGQQFDNFIITLHTVPLVGPLLHILDIFRHFRDHPAAGDQNNVCPENLHEHIVRHELREPYPQQDQEA
jgi:hypothetical protein